MTDWGKWMLIIVGAWMIAMSIVITTDLKKEYQIRYMARSDAIAREMQRACMSLNGSARISGDGNVIIIECDWNGRESLYERRFDQ